MRTIGPSLRIKCKLAKIPSDTEVQRWAERVDGLIGHGFDPEQAGGQVAVELFEIVPGLVAKAQVVTIASLPAEVRKK